jgi:hypothetical protein
MSKTWRGSWGVVQVPLIVGMVIMALALPVALKLGSQNQDTRNLAALPGCKYCSGNSCVNRSGSCNPDFNGCESNANCSGGSCVPNCACATNLCKGLSCDNGCGGTCYGAKTCVIATPAPDPTRAPTTPPRDCNTAATQDCNWNGKPGTQRCNAEGKWGDCQAKNPCSGECLAYASSCSSVGRVGAGGDCAGGVCCGGALPTNTPTLTPTPTKPTQSCDSVGSKCCFGGVEPWCEGGLIESSMDPDNCLCRAAATPTPTATKPTPTPVPLCNIGDKECAGATVLRTCYSPEPGEFLWKTSVCEGGCNMETNACNPSPTPTKPVQTPTPMCTIGEKECVGGVLRTCYSPAPGTLVWNTSVCETGCKTGASECNPTLTPTVSGRPAPKGSYRRPKGL